MTFLFVLFSYSLIQSCSEKKANIDDYDSALVTSSNQKIMEMAIGEDNLFTLKGVRAAAMMHTAMHDALNSIVPKYSRYAYDGEILQANPIATAAYAAYEIAINQYPDKKNNLESELNKWLKDITDENAKIAGKKNRK